ncbi:HPP family protein [Glaciimonas sp. CA11.2]|uniref:HPP family protein n=1 Tax=unclassified Glaciimonas TaxID=2644401 RepID=UPI002AB3EACD|nr:MULTISPECIES: HPP family protein [unclassified Glaciimonas]MDY7546819.1 HPP family protein [Glaciimonas sp. CA11.2]MEB0012288.1 HPP family protein [Glaciimonas sp. Cout2]MEB0080524.1 HPP family protein [Glaciimonas sp. Gout2]MEB0163527.1 HPP family protein [Glaciimonas sp. CA11.2]
MIKKNFIWLWDILTRFDGVDRFERMRACSGALIGITLTGACSYLMLGNSSAALWLIAPMGASAVLLFAVPASPLAQPWSIVGGNLCAGLIGVTCAKLIGEPVLAAGLAAGLAIGAMFWLRCLHPPSGAVALTAVLGGPAIHQLGYTFLLVPVGLNTFLLLLTAILFNNATGRRYPHIAFKDHSNQHALKDPEPTSRVGFTPDDLDVVLSRYNQVLDISRGDLEKIFLETEMEVARRKFGVVTCKELMSRDIVSVDFATELLTAWNLLRTHKLTAIPVLGRGRHVIGIVTKADFVKHIELKHYGQLAKKIRQLLRAIPRAHSSKPEVVGQIMFKDVTVVSEHQAIVELVPLMSDRGYHSIPVVDDDGRLVGMLTQSDLIAGLYKSHLQM